MLKWADMSSYSGRMCLTFFSFINRLVMLSALFRDGWDILWSREYPLAPMMLSALCQDGWDILWSGGYPLALMYSSTIDTIIFVPCQLI